ncbi:cytochrome c oxidase assembly factor 6 homolog [Mantella aurantiaca]
MVDLPQVSVRNGVISVRPASGVKVLSRNKMSAPSAQERKACWDSRDRYWQCLDDSNEDKDKCQQFRKGFEKSCPLTWLKHFDKRRDYLKYKAEMESRVLESSERAKDS